MLKISFGSLNIFKILSLISTLRILPLRILKESTTEVDDVLRGMIILYIKEEKKLYNTTKSLNEHLSSGGFPLLVQPIFKNLEHILKRKSILISKFPTD